jgi:hypothetical protein
MPACKRCQKLNSSADLLRGKCRDQAACTRRALMIFGATPKVVKGNLNG